MITPAMLAIAVALVLALAPPALAVSAKNVAVSRVESTGAVLVVKSDITSNVTVDYGSSPGVYTATTTGTGAVRHELPLAGFTAGSAVYYRVTITDAANPATFITLPEKSFTTARAPGSPFSFAVAGDNRPATDTTVQPAGWNTIVGQMSGESLDLSFNVGDIIFGTGTDTLSQNVAKYDGLFATTTQLTYSTPLYVAAGNHERLNYANSLAGYKQEFTFPVNNGADSASYGELYYSFDNGDTHFIALSTEVPGQEGMITGNQKAWLEADLAANTRPWTVVFMHRPLFSGQHGADPWVNTANTAGQQNKADIHALFLASGVDVVFEGHDHYYLRHVEDGIQYIITGGGGAPLSSVPVLGSGDVAAASTLEHVKVDETESSLGISIIDTSGATVDSLTLTIPKMQLALGNAYWASYADYLSRNLTVDYQLTNSGAGDALGIEVQWLSASSGVSVQTATPYPLGTLASLSSTSTTVQYLLPQGLTAFTAYFGATCTDTRGFIYTFP
jgi:hypothetical protein